MLLHLYFGDVRCRLRLWDAGEFKETEHPRGTAGGGKGGQFVKKGEEGGGGKPAAVPVAPQAGGSYAVSSKIATLLKGLGYSKQKGKPVFAGGGGKEIEFLPPSPGKTISFHWKSTGPGWRIEKTGTGLPALAALLGGPPEPGAPKLTVHQPGAPPQQAYPPAKPGAAAAEQVKQAKPAEKPVVPGIYKPTLEGAGFKHISTDPASGKEVYGGEAGAIIITPPKSTAPGKANSGWEFKPTGKGTIHGEGLANLQEAIDQEAGAAKPAGGPVEPPKGIEQILPHKSGSAGGGVVYSDQPGNKSTEEVAIDATGQWSIWKKGEGTVAEGQGQESLNAAFEQLHPRGPGGQFAEKPGGGEAPQAEPKPGTGKVIGPPLKLDDLTKTGGILGTTPGGTYEDKDGHKYYVKLQDEDHSKNESLAAVLANSAGMETFNYHLLDNGGLASDWRDIGKAGTANMTPAELKKIQTDFAIHAWLANWDVGGAGPEKPSLNMGMTPDGKPICLDWGGALLYRGQGKPKGSAFNEQAGEWELLRDPNKNPTAYKLFGSMTPAELKASAARLNQITTADIFALADQHGPGTAEEKAKLAATLVARKDAILKKAAAEKPKPPPPPPPPKPADPHTLRATIASWNPPNKPESAVTEYKGSGYHPMNALCRFFDLQPDDPSSEAKYIRQITDWLDKSSSQAEVVLYRGVKGEYAERVKQVGNLPGAVGRLLSDDGFVSMSASKAFADGWHGGQGLTMKITVPKGSKLATVYEANHSDSEYEAIAQRGTMFRITKWQPQSKTYEVELVQSHLKS